MISDYPNRMSLGDESDYLCENELPEAQIWSHEFSDGSRISLPEFEDPIVEVHHKRFAGNWMADIAKEHIMEEQLDNDEAIQYILTTFKDED